MNGFWRSPKCMVFLAKIAGNLVLYKIHVNFIIIAMSGY